MENIVSDLKKSIENISSGGEPIQCYFPPINYKITSSIIRQDNFTNFVCSKCGGTGLVSSYVMKCINRNRKNVFGKRRCRRNNILFKTFKEERTDK